jgi:hypothetical protein
MSKTQRQRRHVAAHGSAAFRCDPCDREVVIGWHNLGADTPTCRNCGRKLVLAQAVRGKGLLPPAAVYPMKRRT